MTNKKIPMTDDEISKLFSDPVRLTQIIHPVGNIGCFASAQTGGQSGLRMG